MGHLLTAKGFPRSVVFDLDGTLIDSVPEVCAALNCVLASRGRQTLGVDEAFYMVGEGAMATLERAFIATGAPLDAAATADVMAAYLGAYKEARGANTLVYPGVFEVLRQLKAAGVSMSICTNKPAATTTTTLGGLGLLGFFSRIVCPEDTQHRKPDGGHVLDCLGPTEGATNYAVMVGDSETDMAAARDAGLPFVAVSYGYSHVPVAELNAETVIDHFADLPAALMGLAL